MVEEVVLVDESGKPIGTALKSEVHTANTPLHLAFSCYLFNEDGLFLLTRRALVKKVWPGVWTNSICGHLSPGETSEQAIKRRVKQELGLEHITEPEMILPDYRYTTPPFNGIIENEICPVYAAKVTSELNINPDEVEAYEWVDWPEVLRRVDDNPDIYSYWFKDQLKQLSSNSLILSFAKTI